ncbi:putative odorant receptor 71a isoform X1 [Cephus cinctus]|uniref:Odorant receptor 71a isoform X1 n=1 Tax=Cephus cinctus TaxID=211228 RepID=A0AAJ7W2D4_CEPCN|nr:putative odorant receptor 71a isoform X1 [Cephus cinctus]
MQRVKWESCGCIVINLVDSSTELREFKLQPLENFFDYIVQPLWKKSQFLPTGAWYPFDYKKSTFFYTLAYFQQIICITFSGCASTTEITFGVFIFFACARLKVLQRKFQQLSDNSNGNEKILRRRICNYVQQHCDILRYINDVNETYTFIILVLFLSILLTVCCTSFLIINVTEHSLDSIFINSLLMVASAVQLLFYYLPGHILIEEAKTIAESVYYSGWESLSINCRKLLLQIMVYSASPINLRNGKMGLLILENYTTFLTTAASYLTSLRSIVGTV